MINKEKIARIWYRVDGEKCALENSIERAKYDKEFAKTIDIEEYIEEKEQKEEVLNLIIEIENRIKELEKTNKEHQKLNGELQKKLTYYENICKGKSIQELGTSNLYKED